jgi:hypothetical protein
LVARLVATLTIALAITVPAAAQDWKGMGRVEGKVTDAAGAPLAGASVRRETSQRAGGLRFAALLFDTRSSALSRFCHDDDARLILIEKAGDP